MQSRRSASRQLLLVFLLAFALRFAYVWIHEHRISEPLLAQNAAFSYEQGWIARSIILGKGFSSPKGGDTGPTAMYTPIYPYILVPIYLQFGIFTRKSFIIALALNSFWSALVVLPIFFLARKIRPGAEYMAIWLWTLYPSVIVISDLNWTQALSACFIAFILWLAFLVQDAQRFIGWLLYGLLWGVACLLNPAIFAAMPFVLLWHLWKGRAHFAKYLRFSFLAVAAFLVVCAPWTVRNFRVFHQFVPFRSSFGYELWLGNNDCVPHAWLGASANLDPLYSPVEFADFQREGEVAYIRARKAEAIRFMETHPAADVRFFLLKFATFWTGTWYMPVDTSWKAAHWRFRAILISETLLPFLALPGIWLAWRESRANAIPLFAFLLFFPLVYYITHAHPGYKNPLDPILVLFASLFLARLRPHHLADPHP